MAGGDNRAPSLIHSTTTKPSPDLTVGYLCREGDEVYRTFKRTKKRQGAELILRMSKIPECLQQSSRLKARNALKWMMIITDVSGRDAKLDYI